MFINHGLQRPHALDNHMHLSAYIDDVNSSDYILQCIMVMNDEMVRVWKEAAVAKC